MLYVLHAIATGLAMVIMNLFGVRLGFSFSAGLVRLRTELHPRAAAAATAARSVPPTSRLYYVVFRFCIVRLNLSTPGREPDDTTAPAARCRKPPSRAAAFVTALGGARNLTEVEACTTRLRLVLVDNRAIDEAALKRLGARGVLRSATQGLQVVLGPIADQVAGEIRDALRAGPPNAAAPVMTAPRRCSRRWAGGGNVRASSGLRDGC